MLNESAVATALASKQVGGIAMDVFTEEPPKHSPLLALENVIATPHIAGSTNEAQDAVGVQIASQVREYLKRGVIQNAVNMPSIDHLQYTQMQPYIALAEKLGAFWPTSCQPQDQFRKFPSAMPDASRTGTLN